MVSIRDSGDFDLNTVREAGAFAVLLENQDFKFFLQLFHQIMPHVDILYAKLQKKNIDSVHISGCIQQFQKDIQTIRNSLHTMVEQHSSGSQPSKRRRTCSSEEQQIIAAEVCDTILNHTRERVSFTNHLVSATLLQGDRFDQYKTAFPEDALSKTVKAYPMLTGSKLKTELSLIYSKGEFKVCRGAVDLFQLFMENNLEEVFSETITLLKILITTPMTTAEAERCFSTLKRIKTFLRNTMTQDRLNALTMMSMEKKLVTEMTDFNQRVIERFAGSLGEPAVIMEEVTPTPTTSPKFVRQSQSLSAGEGEYIHKRKQVVLESLTRLGVNCSEDSVPHVALLASGGGQRAAVALLGSLYQMREDDLLDTLLYMGGVSGSTWSMSSLYSDPCWSTNMTTAVSSLSGPGVELEEALAWLGQRAEEETFSLTDIWGILTAAGVMKQMDRRRLSDEADRNATNPYPVYSSIEKYCYSQGPIEGKWFEVTPHEAGFTELGLFVETSYLGSKFQGGDLIERTPEMDMIQLIGVLGCAVATEEVVRELVPPWLNDKVNHDRSALLESKTPEERKTIFQSWSWELLGALEVWSQSLEEGAFKKHVSWLIQKVLPLVVKWEWGTTTNFLYGFQNSSAPPCLHTQETFNLIDAGLLINVGYPPFLGDKRDIDLIIAPEYSAGNMFETLTLARDYAAQVKKPFPEIDTKVLEEKDWPKDCYVFPGDQNQQNQPTILYMPLFNRHNCKDAEEVSQRMEEFSTFQLPYNQEKIDFLLGTARENMRRNKETIVEEIRKAAGRRHNKRSSSGL
ncbi:cytosolic phospholipase A2 gamma-like [Diretmus argenteus]